MKGNHLGVLICKRLLRNAQELIDHDADKLVFKRMAAIILSRGTGCETLQNSINGATNISIGLLLEQPSKSIVIVHSQGQKR